MCLWCASQVVGKEHPAEACVEWAREGEKSNQYWSVIGAVLVTTRSSTGHSCVPVLVEAVTSTASFCSLGEQRAASVAIYLCDSGLRGAAKAS